MRAYLKVQFAKVPWDYILDECEGRRQKIITDSDVDDLMKRASIRPSDRQAVESGLYLLMTQSLRGETEKRVTTATAKNILDQYRMIYFEGMSISELALFTAKGRLWRAPEARSYKELPNAVERWEAERNFLMEHAQLIMNEDDQKFNLLMIAPREMRREILKDYSSVKFPTYLSLKQHLMETVVRESDEMRKGLGAVEAGIAKDDFGPEELAAAREVTEQYKREEGDRDRQDLESWKKVEMLTAELNALKGQKGKGKGKGFKGDCHNCGKSGHSWRNCSEPLKPELAAKGGGKGGKGGQAGDGGKGGQIASGAARFFQNRRGQPSGVRKIGALEEDPVNWQIGQDGQVWAPVQAPHAAAGQLGAVSSVPMRPLRMLGQVAAGIAPPLTTGPRFFDWDREEIFPEVSESVDQLSPRAPTKKMSPVKKPSQKIRKARSRENEAENCSLDEFVAICQEFEGLESVPLPPQPVGERVRERRPVRGRRWTCGCDSSACAQMSKCPDVKAQSQTIDQANDDDDKHSTAIRPTSMSDERATSASGNEGGANGDKNRHTRTQRTHNESKQILSNLPHIGQLGMQLTNCASTENSVSGGTVELTTEGLAERAPKKVHAEDVFAAPKKVHAEDCFAAPKKHPRRGFS